MCDAYHCHTMLCLLKDKHNDARRALCRGHVEHVHRTRRHNTVTIISSEESDDHCRQWDVPSATARRAMPHCMHDDAISVFGFKEIGSCYQSALCRYPLPRRSLKERTMSFLYL